MGETEDLGAFRLKKAQAKLAKEGVDLSGDVVGLPEQPPEITETEALAIAERILQTERAVALKKYLEELQDVEREHGTRFDANAVPTLFEERLAFNRLAYAGTKIPTLLHILAKHKQGGRGYGVVQLLAVAEEVKKRFAPKA